MIRVCAAVVVAVACCGCLAADLEDGLTEPVDRPADDGGPAHKPLPSEPPRVQRDAGAVEPVAGQQAITLPAHVKAAQSFSLSRTACVDRKFLSESQRPFPCSVKQFDSEGALRFERRLDAHGREIYSATHPQSSASYWTTSIRDAAGNVVRQESWRQDGEQLTLSNYTVMTYDANGTLSSKERYTADGQLWRTYALKFDAGRLEEISWSSPSSSYERERFTYYPGGKLKTHGRETYENLHSFWRGETRDEMGRLVAASVSSGMFGCNENWTYDGARLMAYSWTSIYRNEFRSYAHDAEDRWVLEFTHDTYMDTPTNFSTRRAQYACAANDLLLEERDADNDGVIDGVRELQRGPDGRILRELISGTQVKQDLVRTEYDYSCR